MLTVISKACSALRGHKEERGAEGITVCVRPSDEKTISATSDRCSGSVPIRTVCPPQYSLLGPAEQEGLGDEKTLPSPDPALSDFGHRRGA